MLDHMKTEWGRLRGELGQENRKEKEAGKEEGAGSDGKMGRGD